MAPPTPGGSRLRRHTGKLAGLHARGRRGQPRPGTQRSGHLEQPAGEPRRGRGLGDSLSGPQDPPVPSESREGLWGLCLRTPHNTGNCEAAQPPTIQERHSPPHNCFLKKKPAKEKEETAPGVVGAGHSPAVTLQPKGPPPRPAHQHSGPEALGPERGQQPWTGSRAASWLRAVSAQPRPPL